jgi:hypothetical protein
MPSISTYATRLERLEQAAPASSGVWATAIIDCDDRGRYMTATVSSKYRREVVERMPGEALAAFQQRIRASRSGAVDWIFVPLIRAIDGARVSGDEEWPRAA